jgi:hypothetical protein
MAATKDRTKHVQLLLSYGPDESITGKGDDTETALAMATRHAAFECKGLLEVYTRARTQRDAVAAAAAAAAAYVAGSPPDPGPTLVDAGTTIDAAETEQHDEL